MKFRLKLGGTGLCLFSPSGSSISSALIILTKQFMRQKRVTSYTLFIKEYNEKLSKLKASGDQQNAVKSSVRIAWAQLPNGEKEEYKTRAKILRTNQSVTDNQPSQDDNKPLEQDSDQIIPTSTATIKLPNRYKEKSSKRMPKQESLHIYDPKVVYEHKLYSSKGRKTNKILPTPASNKDAKKLSSNKGVNRVVMASSPEFLRKPLPRDDSILVSYAKDVKPTKNKKFEEDVKEMLLNLSEFEESSVGKTIATNYVSQLMMICQKLRIPLAKYSYEEQRQDDGTLSFFGAVNLELDDSKTITINGLNSYKNKKLARQNVAYLALTKFIKLKGFANQ
ncbi:hypothetical protein TrispH2_009317 [Trichoplax sp. H2]|nr:hypothetical protein TrispH2_009317 [Trichoplax sp. H2]|eukprot:RDD37570.1 hypothetical protein TrispH2_009317 [Trichoplax sp. H2]